MTTETRTPTSADEYLAYKQRFNNWGRWGDSDQHGTLNHITDETRRDAIALVEELIHLKAQQISRGRVGSDLGASGALDGERATDVVLVVVSQQDALHHKHLKDAV